MAVEEYRIDFEGIEWRNVANGIRLKQRVVQGTTFRLVEYRSGFEALNWSDRAQKGYMIDGRISVIIDGQQLNFEQGDGICIPANRDCRHKGTIPEGEHALMILVEQGDG